MDLSKKGFQLPEKIRFEEDTLTDTYGKLIAEPLERGFGTTVGNSLRRVLLSSIEGAAVTGVRIRGALHEFTSVPGVKEDVVDIVLNVKSLQFRMNGKGPKTASLSAKGPGAVTGGEMKTDGTFKVLNPGQVIATLDKGASFEAELYLSKGKGYVPAELNKSKDLPIDVIAVDSNFNPVKKVNFTVERARVGRSTDYDKLILEVWTNGAISPGVAVSQAAAILAGHLDFFVLEEEEAAEAEQKAMFSKDAEVFNPNLLKNVEDMELSVRAHNCLKNAEIDTIAELVQKSENEMLRTKNFGRKSLNEIKEILGTMGLGFGMRIDPEALQKMKESRDAS